MISHKAEKSNVLKRFSNIIILIYWLLIFDGALRKWLLPSLEKPLYFLKDPFVLYVYYLAFKYQLWPKDDKLFLVCLAMIGCVSLWAAIQGACGIASIPTLLYGLRMYFLCMPLAFLIGKHFGRQGLLRLVRHSLLISILMAIIVFVQYKSPPGAWINKLLAEDSEAFVYGGVARASGTFSFTAGHMQFAGTLACIAMACWLLPKNRRPLRPVLFIITSLSVLINILLDGNRSVLFYCAITYLFSVVHRLIAPSKKRFNIRALAPEIMLVTGGIIYYCFLSTAMEAMISRVDDPKDQEGLAQRLIKMANPLEPLATPHFSILGAGLGNGLPGGAALRGSFQPPKFLATAEDEQERLLLEAGMFGLFLIFFRYAMAVRLLTVSWQCSRQEGFPLAMLLASYSAYQMWQGQLSMNGTAEYYGWLFVGFTLAAAKPQFKQDDYLKRMRLRK